MFCQICGSKLRSTARFCNHCGKPIAERFGSALLEPPTHLTLEQRVGQTSEHEVEGAPTTPELMPKPPTNQIQQRGTDRQSLAKATGPEAAAMPKPEGTLPLGTPPGAITNVSRPYPDDLVGAAQTILDEIAPPSFGEVSRVNTLVEDEAAAGGAPLELSTAELQRHAAAKPFFTQMLTPGMDGPGGRQHRRLALAVPLVVVLLLVLLVLAYLAAK
jgi:hypothetical protein